MVFQLEYIDPIGNLENNLYGDRYIRYDSFDSDFLSSPIYNHLSDSYGITFFLTNSEIIIIN